jgi:hypothetical protein
MHCKLEPLSKAVLLIAVDFWDLSCLQYDLLHGASRDLFGEISIGSGRAVSLLTFSRSSFHRWSKRMAFHAYLTQVNIDPAPQFVWIDRTYVTGNAD